ncbi:MAG: prfA [Clostridiaceae bacterium]|jgi:peptide chain release factor 1|nr:prfA [Clostridiaceae bacterium]
MKIYLEVRACTGGEEAMDFANELLSVYLKYARKNNMKVEFVSDGKTKVIMIEGKTEFINPFISEEGIHKVQRVSKGKLHTSTVSIVILQVQQNKKIEINRNDIRVDNYRGSGAGGQHRNTTDSAVRITHIPTGIVVCCENERSQHQNKDVAIEILYSKIQKFEENKRIEKLNKSRSSQVGTGDRAESRRTYNYTRGEVIDTLSSKRCSLKEFMDKANLNILK